MASPHRAAVVLLVVLLALAAAPAPASAVVNNVVTQWMNTTATCISTMGLQNHLGSRLFGQVATAMSRALDRGGAPPVALAAFAAHGYLSASFPWGQGGYDMLIAKQLAGVSPADLDKAEAVAVPIAHGLLRERIGDGSTRWSRFKPAPPGTRWRYQFTPNQTMALYPQMATTRPFILPAATLKSAATNTQPARGPVMKLPATSEYMATFELGSRASAKRTPYQTGSVFFWNGPTNTSGITGMWLDIGRQLLPASFTLKQTADFYARAGLSAYDASIAGWQVKYGKMGWRPVTAFRSGYPGFTPVPTWTPLLMTPPHPEYPSGHMVTVGALLEVILDTLGGRDKVEFSVRSQGAPWVGERRYTSLTAAAQEVANSRLWAGVHFPSSNADGLALGRFVGKQALAQHKRGSSAPALTLAFGH